MDSTMSSFSSFLLVKAPEWKPNLKLRQALSRRAINQLTLVQKWPSCRAEKKHSLNTKVHLAQTCICPKIALQRRVGIHLDFIEKGARMSEIVSAVSAVDYVRALRKEKPTEKIRYISQRKANGRICVTLSTR